MSFVDPEASSDDSLENAEGDLERIRLGKILQPIAQGCVGDCDLLLQPLER